MMNWLTVLRWASREWRNAKVSGYFFLPCPICGRPFSGAEAMKLARPMALKSSKVEGKLVCGLASCQRDAYNANAANGFITLFDPPVNPFGHI